MSDALPEILERRISMHRFTTPLFLALVLVFPALARAETTIAQTDKDFLTNAAQAGMAEVKLAELASTRASDPSVKSFAQKMAADHGQANEKLKTLAQKKGLILPTSIGADTQKKIDDMAKLSGADFDKAYMDQTLKDHDAAITLFQNAADNSKDKDIQNFATTTLPTLKSHQHMAHGYSPTKPM
jgi:putative membrane protein